LYELDSFQFLYLLQINILNTATSSLA